MVQGLAEFQRRWGAIPDAVRINVRAAMENAAEDLVQEIWQYAPFDEGTLANSIGWTWGDAPAGTLVLGTASSGKEYGALRITIYVGGGDAFHAPFIEFGTEKMPARPFFFPVWRARRKKIRARIAAAMRKAIRDAIR